MADPILTQEDVERFWGHTAFNQVTGCVEWALCRFRSGYGQVKVAGRNRVAHRIAWIAINGPVPPGRQVLHRCDNRACVDVLAGHLFLGDHAANMADMVAKGRHRNQLVTHCPRGHPYDAENTYLYARTGARYCRACISAGSAKRYQRHREQRKAKASAYYYNNRERILARLREKYHNGGDICR